MIKILKPTHLAAFKILITIVLTKSCPADVAGWSDHPVLAKAALSDLSFWNNIDSVEAKSLTTFLLETGHELEGFLLKQELRFRSELEVYPFRPEELAFVMHEDTSDIATRFLHAIRINPTVNLGFFLYLMPGEDYGERHLALQDEISLLQIENIYYPPQYVWINVGDFAHPLDILATANDEPDYGFDIGLFDDNNTWFGQIYGFGKQPFGNPNIFYTSQVPFHMGFYHEDPVVYAFASFLTQTYLEYRINVFRELAVFAFNHNQRYWGWRFLGWSMHYAGDASMPYHAKPLPGLSLWQMIWIGIKRLLGFHQSTHDAVQLVSNKHILLEEYQAQEIRMAYLRKDLAHPFFRALKNNGTTHVYDDSFIRNIVSKIAADESHKLDRSIIHNMPAYLTSDPKIEISTLSQSRPITHVMIEEKGAASVDDLNHAIAFHLQWFGITLRSLLFSVMEETELIDKTGPEPYILAGGSEASFFHLNN
jgi:hypothetical protein